ncbi:hypothetical protein ABH19_03920 [Leptospirillum sp. Group II 'CF-1']|nr:hypothetical protein ABH19_03920 [Leptospirillum sp. Group II 'CF-1']
MTLPGPAPDRGGGPAVCPGRGTFRPDFSVFGHNPPLPIGSKWPTLSEEGKTGSGVFPWAVSL